MNRSWAADTLLIYGPNRDHGDTPPLGFTRFGGQFRTKGYNQELWIGLRKKGGLSFGCFGPRPAFAGERIRHVGAYHG
jgi:hypothetical protein